MNAFFSFLFKTAMEWVWGKLTALWSMLARREVVKKEAEESVEPLRKAETGQEIDDATDDALNHL